MQGPFCGNGLWARPRASLGLAPRHSPGSVAWLISHCSGGQAARAAPHGNGPAPVSSRSPPRVRRSTVAEGAPLTGGPTHHVPSTLVGWCSAACPSARDWGALARPGRQNDADIGVVGTMSTTVQLGRRLRTLSRALGAAPERRKRRPRRPCCRCCRSSTGRSPSGLRNLSRNRAKSGLALSALATRRDAPAGWLV